jgi:hypothetical protein
VNRAQRRAAERQGHSTRQETVALAYLHPGQVEGSAHHSLAKLTDQHLLGLTPKLAYRFPTESGSGGVGAARNEIAKMFLKTDADWLFWVDSDMGFAPDALHRLYAVADKDERPIVGGLCFSYSAVDGSESDLFDTQYRAMPTIYQFSAMGLTPLEDYESGTLIECDATGSAFILIHRSVYEAMAGKFDPAAPFYYRMIHEGLEWGEDTTFCLRAKALGFPVHVDTTVQTSHKKTIYVTEKVFRLQQALEAPMTDTVISLLVPSRGRPDQLIEMWESAKDKATRPELLELVVRVDSDDPSLPLYGWVDEDKQARLLTGERGLLSGYWNECFDAATGDILMHAGDDIRFRSPFWDVKVRGRFDRSDDKILLVHGNDGFQGGNLATHGFLHRRWVETVGYFVPPKFSSDYNDTWLTEVADRLGRRVYLEDVYTEHLHPAAGKGEWDATHKERLERHQADRVDDLYASTAAEREADAQKLMAVMS